VVIAVSSGEVVSTNRAWCRMVGLEKSAVQGNPILETLPFEGLDDFIREILLK